MEEINSVSGHRSFSLESQVQYLLQWGRWQQLYLYPHSHSLTRNNRLLFKIGSKLGKRLHQGCILSLCLFNFYEEDIMLNAGLNEAKLESRLPACTHAKSLQSCLTLCNPIDGSPQGFSVPGILQANILEWVAISFSNACMHAKSLHLCWTLCNPMDSSPPGSFVHGILQARILEWVAIPSPMRNIYIYI